MAYLCVNKRGEEFIFRSKPKRDYWEWCDEQWAEGECYSSDIELPKGSIKKLIGRELTWDDEPVEI